MKSISLPSSSLSQQESVVQVMAGHAKNFASRPAFYFLEDGEYESAQVSFGQVFERAQAVAAKLQVAMEEGDRALLLFPAGLSFIEGFLGCILAKITAVPAYPPRANRNIERIEQIMSDCGAKVILTTRKTIDLLSMKKEVSAVLNKLKVIATDEISTDLASDWQHPKISASDTAFLQYTSGSTGNPKGVKVSHRNILTNVAMFQTGMGFTQKSVMASWLPLYHDMGLIGGVLGPLLVGFPCVLMPPVAFLERPARWLKAISKYKATVAGGPNFAYDLCTKRVSDEELARLDLSSLSVLYNGAEPVRAATIEKFSRKFAAAGFNGKAFFPCYGLAEATLIISGGPVGAGAHVASFHSSGLESGQVSPAEADATDSQQLVSSGQVYNNEDVRIINPETGVTCTPNQIGEIWVSGQHIAGGYWQKTKETQESFHAKPTDKLSGEYLRTGDLGFIFSDQLFITGRLKDLIIINGVNHYPQDIEATVEAASEAVRGSGVVAYAETHPIRNKEELSLVIELERKFIDADFAPIADAVAMAVVATHEVSPSAIYLVKPGQVLKTSSGKIQRSANRKAINDKSLSVLYAWTIGEAGFTPPIEVKEPLQLQKQILKVIPTPVTSVKNEPFKTIITPKPAKMALVTPPANIESMVTALQKWFLKQEDFGSKELDPGVPLTRYGVDSVTIIALQTFVDDEFKLKIPQSIFMEHPTLNSLAKYIVESREGTSS